MPRPERPLDPDAHPLDRFAADLRGLREKAGGPAYRELARRAHYSWSTLADAAAGRKLPSLPVTLAYVRACGGDAAEWEDRWRELAGELAGPPPGPDASPAGEPCPYPGLRAFQAEDAEYFFGREQLTDDIADRVRANRFLAVFGASGSGKSSLLRAGLIARARRDHRWAPLLFTPGPHPLEECAARLSARVNGSAVAIHRDLSTDSRALHLTVLQALHDEPPDVDLLLVVDQFEEVFTLCPDRAQRAAFITALLAAAQAANSRTRVVLGVRADFYQHCSEFPELVAALPDGQMLVGPMTTDELRRAVSLPAARAECTVEGALLARVVGDAAGQPHQALPLVSHALRQAWAHRRGNTLTLAAYEAVGGIRHALAQSAESVYDGLSPDGQRLARSLFLRLVAFGEGTEDLKRRVGREELGPELDGVLDVLATARLVTVDARTVEIAHEALLSAWPRLREWIDADRAGLRMHQQFTDTANLWQHDRRDSGLLYRGARLAAAGEWAHRHPEAMVANPRAAEFLRASVRHERRVRRGRNAVIAGLCALALVAAGAAVTAIQQNDVAQAKSNGLAGAQTSAEAGQLADTDVSLAAQLDLVSDRSQPTPQTYADLLSSENQPLATLLTGHTAAVYCVAMSPDGKTLASTSRDGTVRLWNLSDRAHPRPWGPSINARSGRIYWAAFSPNGRTLATADGDHTIRLWNITDRAHPVAWGPPLTGHTDLVNSVEFSADGRLLVSAGADQTVRLWDVADPARPTPIGRPLTGSADAVNLAVFSPDGRTVASADHAGMVHLWNITDPANPIPLGTPLPAVSFPPDVHSVFAVAFSPNGRLLATGGDDHMVRLWDVSDPAHPRPLGQPLVGHANTVFAVAFSPTGNLLASAGADRTVRLWDLTDPAHPIAIGKPLVGHTGYIYSLAFSADGTSLASADADDTVRVWNLPATLLIGHTDRVLGVAFSPDGRLLASAGVDDSVRLWDISNPARPRPLGQPLIEHTGGVLHVSFSPNGTMLAAAGADGTVRLWDVTDPAHPVAVARLTGHRGRVETVAFSPNRRILATAGDDATVRLWDVTKPTDPIALGQPLAGHSKTVFSLAFSHDGRVLASSSADDTVVLWNLADPQRPRRMARMALSASGVFDVAFSPNDRLLAVAGSDSTVRLWNVHDPTHPSAIGEPLAGHTSFVYWIGFSPDGRTLASASEDATVRLWDVTNPDQPVALGQLTGHTGPIHAAAMSPDGRVLATGSDDHTIQLTLLDEDQARSRICTTTAGNLTPSQWQRYVPELPFTPPCP